MKCRCAKVAFTTFPPHCHVPTYYLRLLQTNADLSRYIDGATTIAFLKYARKNMYSIYLCDTRMMILNVIFCFLMYEGVIVCASVCSIRCMRKQSLKFWRLILGSYTFSKCSIFRPVWGLFDKAGRVKRVYIQTCKVHCALWGCFWHKYVIVTSILCCCFSWQHFEVVAYVRIENYCDCYSEYFYLPLHSSINIDEADNIVSAMVLGIFYNKTSHWI